MAKKIDAEGRGFLLGLIYAAWFLHDGHGADSYAQELLGGAGQIETLQRLAQKNEYWFRRGFWKELKRQRARSRGLPTTRELTGSEPNITEGLSTAAYIDSIRSDE